jgi:Flp pilus assembly protein TadD
VANPVNDPSFGLSRAGLRTTAIVTVALCTCGCSFDLGSMSSSTDKAEPAQVTSSGNDSTTTEAIKDHSVETQASNARGQTLARSGNSEEALAEFNKAISLDPHNAQALYNRGMLYQTEKQHELAIDDFTSANSLLPQQTGPLLGRARSYLALDKVKEATVDLDEAAQAEPQNAQIWTARGLAYERLGNKDKAAGSYARAMILRPKDDEAKTGFARVGGKPGQSYDTF